MSSSAFSDEVHGGEDDAGNYLSDTWEYLGSFRNHLWFRRIEGEQSRKFISGNQWASMDTHENLTMIHLEKIKGVPESPLNFPGTFRRIQLWNSSQVGADLLWITHPDLFFKTLVGRFENILGESWGCLGNWASSQSSSFLYILGWQMLMWTVSPPFSEVSSYDQGACKGDWTVEPHIEAKVPLFRQLLDRGRVGQRVSSSGAQVGRPLAWAANFHQFSQGPSEGQSHL